MHVTMANDIDPELHSVSGHDSTEATHLPFRGDRGDLLPPAACAFMTGGPRNSFPGLECVLRRLKADVKLDESEQEKKRFSKVKDMYKPLTDWWKDSTSCSG